MPLFDSQRGVDAPWLFEARTLAGVRSQRMPPRFVSHRRALRAVLAFPATSLSAAPPQLAADARSPPVRPVSGAVRRAV